MMLNSIAGRSVIVTGSTKGIGKGIARVFARAGTKVLIAARTVSDIEATVNEFRGEGWTAAGCQTDVTDWASVQSMAQAAVDAFGSIDVLCSNAGAFPQSKILDMDPDEWDFVLKTNLKSAFLTVKACMPHMKAGGRVVLTSSITGPVTGFPGWTHYGASKAGQLGFLKTAAIELAPRGITINAVLPGNIKTEGLDGLGEAYLATMAASIPLKRLGDTADIGNAALFFASDEAGYITGQTLVVDGGQILPESLEALEAAEG